MLFFKLLFLFMLFGVVLSANPENVTCTPSSILSDWITIDCWIYPSCRIEDIDLQINNKTYTSSTNDKQLDITCTSITPANGSLDNGSKCSIGINLTILGPGNNHIKLTVSIDVGESNFTVTSNDVIIPLYYDLQEPTCSQPNITNDALPITMDCLTSLYYKNVSCSLVKRTDGMFTSTVASVMGERVLDANETFSVKCHFAIMPSDLGTGRHELKITLSSTNSEGEKITSWTNWTNPLNFFLPTEMSFTVNESPEGVVADIGKNATLFCSANGFPSPTLLIERDEPSFPGFGIYFIQNYTYSFTVSSCRSTGIYNCSYIGHLSSSSYTLTKRLYISTQCPLRSLSDRFLDSNNRYIGDFLNTTFVSFEVFGYPGPKSMNIFKTRYSDEYLANDSVNVTYTQGYGPHGSVYIKFINTELIKELQDFTLNIDNGAGNTTFRFSIQAASAMSIYGSATSIWICIVYITSRLFI